jgi:hypothetical protein
MAMTFSGAKLLPGWHRVFLGIGQMLPGIPELFPGAFLLLGKTPPFPGTLKRIIFLLNELAPNHVLWPLAVGSADGFKIVV